MTSKVEKVARAIVDDMHAYDGLGGWDKTPEAGRSEALKVARAAISAHESALAEEGFVIVPRLPTEAMIEHGRAATAAFHNIQGSALTVAREKMRRRYVACIDAALSDKDVEQKRMEQVPRKSASHRGCSGAGEDTQ